MNDSILEISKETGKPHIESMNELNNSKGVISILPTKSSSVIIIGINLMKTIKKIRRC
jgi:hypothetical protein